jgi:hypothetical protein
MPLKLNVGLARKLGEANYGSRGASINLELELDSSLVSEPAKLQERIRQLFGLVKSSLVEELNGGHAPASQRANDSDAGSPSKNNSPAGRASGQRGTPPRSATQSQVKAIFAIARSQGLDLAALLQERFQVSRPDALTIQEASQLIDHLKNSGDRGGS